MRKMKSTIGLEAPVGLPPKIFAPKKKRPVTTFDGVDSSGPTGTPLKCFITHQELRALVLCKNTSCGRWFHPSEGNRRTLGTPYCDEPVPNPVMDFTCPHCGGTEVLRVL